MLLNHSLKGKVAIVTGARMGIGREVALTLAHAGADVAVCSRNDAVKEVAGEVEKLGRRCLAMKADVSKEADVNRMVDEVTSKFGRIDVLVNNAGVVIWEQTLLGATEEDWNYLMDVNLKGAWLFSKAVGPKMVEQGQGGTIVNFGSIAGGPGIFAGIPIYCVSKAGIRMLTRTLAQELAPYKIRVNAVEPGWVKTDMNIRWRPDDEAEEAIANSIPLSRISEPKDLARLVLFLASDASDYITGQSILMDGGLFDAPVG